MSALLYTRGMTLVEAVVAIALFTVLSLVVTNGISALYRYNAYTFAQAYQVQNARSGMQSLIRDVREMTFGDNGSFPLVIMEPHKIGFYSDIDRDQSVEYVEYELIATTTEFVKRVYNATGTPPIYPVVPDTTYTLSQYVQNFAQNINTFRYYTADGTEVTSPNRITDVRYITADIIVNIDPVRDPGEFTLRSSAALRNVRENI